MTGGNTLHHGHAPSSELGTLGNLMERHTLTQHEVAELRTGLAETVYGIVQDHLPGEPLGAEEIGQLQFIRDQRDVGGASELTPGQRIADELVLGLLLDRYSSATGEAAPGYF